MVASDQLAIGPYADSDPSTLLALWGRCDLPTADAARSIEFAKGRDHITILVGKLDGVLVASAMVGHDGHAGFIYLVAVDPPRQGKGFGRAIMRAAEAWLADRGLWRIMLLVRQDNAKVLGFYQHLGWEIPPNIVMQKRLRP